MAEQTAGQDDIESEAQRELVEGQNFYDQLPFSTIVREVSSESSIAEEWLRTLLTYIARFVRDRVAWNKDTSGFLEQPKSKRMQNPRSILYGEAVKYMGKYHPNEEQRANLKRAIPMLGTRLQSYESWDDYIVGFMEHRFYDSDGSYKHPPDRFFGNKTYTQYEAQVSRERGEPRRVDTKGVLPEGFPQEPLSMGVAIRLRRSAKETDTKNSLPPQGKKV